MSKIIIAFWLRKLQQQFGKNESSIWLFFNITEKTMCLIEDKKYGFSLEHIAIATS